MQVKKQQLEPDMEQQTGSNLGKVYIKAIYFHPAYLTSMQSTSWEMPEWMKLKLESRLLGKILIISDMQMRNITNLWYADDTILMAESEGKQKSILMKVKEESEKAGLKTQHSKN